MLMVYIWLSTLITGFLFCTWNKKDNLNIFLKCLFFGVTILGVVNLYKLYN